jgi:hypothetical protein
MSATAAACGAEAAAASAWRRVSPAARAPDSSAQQSTAVQPAYGAYGARCTARANRPCGRISRR